ncbi:alkyl hydroperoxide reductase subunit F [Bacteroidia bacterium]|nr:alkyl hydroperoxide reductase subunit F [Bacteroidia bacterium]
MLDPTFKIQLQEQLQSIFSTLEAYYVLDITSPLSHESREELLELLQEVAASSDHITCRVNEGQELAFSLLMNGEATGIRFRGIPNGHEFTSLLMAILNSDGKGKNIPDKSICNRVMALKGDIHLTTYVSLTCTTCPDVVQALNLMALLNPRISHEMVDGGIHQDEVEALKIQGVPSVFADGKLLHVGKSDFGELLEKLEDQYGVDAEKTEAPVKNYDVIVVGGGPSGSSAAIYIARKGLNVALLADRVGGQVKETVGIENLISVPYTTGEELAAHLKTHIQNYPIDLFEHRRVEKVELRDKEKVVTTVSGETFIAPSLIIATGASWRRLNVPGESEYIGRGVAFCPHCDGPFYKGKHVAVIGGGNSGIEAAIDLSGICSKVTVFEFLDELKADKVLQEKACQQSNIEIFTSSQTLEVIGNGEKVTALKIKNRKTEEERTMDLDGVFVQIGLSANSSVFKDIVTTNRVGEIEIDAHNRTSQPGVYAAGDVSIVPYKQIIISMGEGAKAALSAFEDRMRGI